ncbi:monocarboxylate transporter 13-like [Glandiceps talaboti]
MSVRKSYQPIDVPSHVEKSKTQEIEPKPPDGGWGWFVVLGTFITLSLSTGSVFSFGVFYVAFLDAFNESKADTVWVGSIAAFLCTVSGPLSLSSSRRFGHRKTVMTGGLITAIGFLLSSYATKLIHLYFTYGILIGIGLGLTHLSAMEMISIYFKRRFPFAMGIGIAGSGFGQFVISIGCQALLDVFGWRGSLMIFSTISLHSCVAGSLFRPLKMKKCRQKLHEKETPDCEPDNGYILINGKDETGDVYKISELDVGARKLKNTEEEVTSLETSPKCGKLKSCMASLYDVTLFKEPAFVILLLSVVANAFGTSAAVFHAVKRAVDLGIPATKAAFIPALMGVGQFLGRVTVGSIGNLPKMKPDILYSVSLLGCTVTNIVSIYTTTFTGQIITLSIFGVSLGGFIVMLPVTVTYFLGSSRMGHGMSVILQVSAVLLLVSGPFVGLMRDVYEGYDEAFWVCGCALVISTGLGLSMSPVEKFFKKRRSNKNLGIPPNRSQIALIKKPEEKLEDGDIVQYTSTV